MTSDAPVPPRPQYGEYASAEEQRVRAGREAVEPVAVPAAPAPTVAPRPRLRWGADAVVTVALLAYGLASVFASGASYLDMSATVQRTMGLIGIEGTFSNHAQGRLWGTVAAVVLAVGWATTAALSVRRLRRGKRTWWVPLVGAVLTTIVAALCATIPVLSDPAFLAYVEGMRVP